MLSGLVVILLAIRYAGSAEPGRLDQSVWMTVAAVWPRPGMKAAVAVSLGHPFVIIALAGLLSVACLTLRRGRLAFLALAGPGLTGLLTTVLKPMVARTIGGDNLAYPSGHTGAATALTFVIMLLVVDLLHPKRLPAVVLVLAGAGSVGAMMALSLVGLRIHYPTDTLGGLCIAMAAVPATAWLVDRFAGTEDTSPVRPG